MKKLPLVIVICILAIASANAEVIEPQRYQIINKKEPLWALGDTSVLLDSKTGITWISLPCPEQVEDSLVKGTKPNSIISMCWQKMHYDQAPNP